MINEVYMKHRNDIYCWYISFEWIIRGKMIGTRVFNGIRISQYLRMIITIAFHIYFIAYLCILTYICSPDSRNCAWILHSKGYATKGYCLTHFTYYEVLNLNSDRLGAVLPANQHRVWKSLKTYMHFDIEMLALKTFYCLIINLHISLIAIRFTTLQKPHILRRKTVLFGTTHKYIQIMWGG